MIYLQLKGGLGNQLFQYAAAKSLSAQNHNEPICLIGENLIEPVNEDVAGDLHFTFLMRCLMKIYCDFEARHNKQELFQFESRIRRFYQANGLFLCQNGYIDFDRKSCKKKDLYINGYLQSEKYFSAISDSIKALYRQQRISEENKRFVELINCADNPVCVHIRLGDYEKNALHGVCTENYYREGIRIILNRVKNPSFFVFSNDIGKAKTIMNAMGVSAIYETGRGSSFEMLNIMASCGHFVISNSSFSWWAQYLSDFPNKTVVAPDRWYAKECPCDIYQGEWVLVKTNS